MNARDHVRLRPIDFDDLKKICRWLNQEEVADGLILRNSVAIADEMIWYENYRKDETKKVFAIEYKGKHVGNVSLFNIDTAHHRAMLSVFIGDRRFRRKGIGLEAMKQILAHSFEEMSLNRIWLEVLKENRAAIRTYEKLGMKKEGVLRHHASLHDKSHDVCVFSILKKEFLHCTGKSALEGE